DRRLSAVRIPEPRDVHSVHFGRRLREFEAELVPPRVEIRQAVGAEAELDAAGRIVGRSGMQRERGLAGRELAPERRRELELKAKDIAVEGDRLVHVADIFD